MKHRLTLARRRALRALHGNREQKTLARLSEAMNRMEAGTPRRIAMPFRWTKANLAREAAVHITTILFKEEDGSYRFAAILGRFEALRNLHNPAPVPIVQPESAEADDAATHEMEQELARQAGMICELRTKIRDLECREADIHDLMEKNAALRDECRRLQAELKRPA